MRDTHNKTSPPNPTAWQRFRQTVWQTVRKNLCQTAGQAFCRAVGQRVCASLCPAVCASLCLAVCASLCLALPSQSKAADATRALDRLKGLTASVSTLRSAFTQTTQIPLFTEPVVSEGQILYKAPDSLLWEYTSPVSQGLAFSGDRGFRWEGNKDQRTAFATAGDPVAALLAAELLAWIRFDRDRIESRYQITAEEGEDIAFTLLPKSPDIAAVISSLNLRFGTDGIARSIIIREASGGTTTLTLHGVRINGPVAAGEFL